MHSGLNFAYPAAVFPWRLRRLDVRVPVSPAEAGEWFSFRSDACTTSCCAGLPTGLETGRTATITGMVNGRPGRADDGGPISKVRLYSRLELAAAVFAGVYSISCAVWCAGLVGAMLPRIEMRVPHIVLEG